MRHAVRLAVAMAALTLSACGVGSDGTTEVTSNCLPQLPDPVPAITAARPDAIDVYLDTSVSSTHFGRAEAGTPYRDVLAFLIDEVGRSDRSNLLGFANAIAPIDTDAARAAARGTAGVCAACGQSQTRLDDLLSRLAGDRNAPLSVAVTDLWLDNNDVLDSRSLSLSRPLRDIMESGRAIGIVGVPAPYTQQVYDIPVGARTATLPRGSVRSRPFFILLIGEPDEVMGMKSMLDRDVLAGDLAGISRFAIFSPEPILESGGLAVATPIGADEAFTYPTTFVSDREDIPALRISKSVAGDLVFAADEGNESSAQGLVLPTGAAAGTDVILSAAVWVLEGPWSEACDPTTELESWVEAPDFPRTYVNGDKAGDYIFSAADEMWLDLPSGETYYMVWEAVGSGPSATGDISWLENWSFAPSEGAALLDSPPDVFPVLNLATFRDLLMRAQADANPSPRLASGALIIETE